MHLALIYKALIAILLIAFATPWAHADGGLLPVPALTGPVIDQTGTLSASDKAALEMQLQTLEQTRGAQVVVLMVPTTAPEDIASFANRVGNSWKIGRRDVGDGVLVIVAKNDRKMRIEVAKALEGAIPDIAAARIIDGAMKPRFQQSDYAGGLRDDFTQAFTVTSVAVVVVVVTVTVVSGYDRSAPAQRAPVHGPKMSQMSHYAQSVAEQVGWFS